MHMSYLFGVLHSRAVVVFASQSTARSHSCCARCLPTQVHRRYLSIFLFPSKQALLTFWVATRIPLLQIPDIATLAADGEIRTVDFFFFDTIFFIDVVVKFPPLPPISDRR